MIHQEAFVCQAKRAKVECQTWPTCPKYANSKIVFKITC